MDQHCVKATEFKNRFGQYLMDSQAEPVFVEKSGRPAAVLISTALYEHYQGLEDLAWALRAREAEQEGYMSTEESEALLKSGS